MLKNYKSYVVNVTTTAAEAIPRNKGRRAMIMHNQGSADVKWYLDDKNTAFVTLKAGETMHLPYSAMNAVTMLTDSGTSTVTVLEG